MWKIINWRKRSSTGEYAEAQKDVEVRYPGIPEKTYQMERRRKRKRIKEHIDTFISDSTLHGLHFCFDRKHLIRRIMWTLVLLAAFGYVSEKLYASVQEFLSYPLSTATTVKYVKNMEFPAISFCNRNDFRKSKYYGTKLQTLPASRFDLLNGTEYRDIVDSSNHRLVDMLEEASFGGIPLSVDNFTYYWDNSGTTKCYTVNWDKSSPWKVSKIGEKGALSLTLNIQHYEYDNTTNDAGAKLILHGQDETPIKTPGILLSPGLHTYVAVSKIKKKNLPHPYITKCGSKKLNYFEEYSQHLCWLDSLTTHVLEKCHCIDAFMPGDNPVCDLERLNNCTWGTWENFDNKMEYDCPIPCDMFEFRAQLSQALFPSNSVADKLAKKYKLAGSLMENRLFIRENFLKVTIFYSDLSYEYVEQQPSYDLKILLGDIGGQLGLFLGSSVLTYLEIVDCLFMLVYTKYFEIFLPR
eukprot:gene5315-5984_t